MVSITGRRLFSFNSPEPGKVALAFLLAVHGTAEAQIQLTISVSPPANLPGIVPSLRVIARNTGSLAAKVPAVASLVVARADGQDSAFAISNGRTAGLTMRFPVRDQGSLEVPAGGSLDLSFWTAGPDAPAWFWEDDRLRTPGTYSIKLTADDRESANDHSLPAKSDASSPPIASNEVSYTVLEPRGPDAAVWSLIRDHPERQMWPTLFADEIWQSYPESRYAAYCVPQAGADLNAMLARYETVLRRDPDAVTADAYRLRMAGLHISMMWRAVDNGNLSAAMTASDSARELLKLVAREASDPSRKKKAEEKLQTDVQTRTELIEAIEAAQGRLPKDGFFAVSGGLSSLR